MQHPTRELAEIVQIQRGPHQSFKDGACAMELVAWMAGEAHTDHPECASPVIGAFVRLWNDALGDKKRQRLAPYLVRVIGTKGTKEQEKSRTKIAWDWTLTVYAATWLRAAGLRVEAQKVLQMRENGLGAASFASENLAYELGVDPLEIGDYLLCALGPTGGYAAIMASRPGHFSLGTLKSYKAIFRNFWHPYAWKSLALKMKASFIAMDRNVTSNAVIEIVSFCASIIAQRGGTSAAVIPVIEELQESAVELLDSLIRVTEDEKVLTESVVTANPLVERITLLQERGVLV